MNDDAAPPSSEPRRPGTDPHQNPTDPPREVPLEPNPAHPGSDPVQLPTEPRAERRFALAGERRLLRPARLR